MLTNYFFCFSVVYYLALLSSKGMLKGNNNVFCDGTGLKIKDFCSNQVNIDMVIIRLGGFCAQ